MSNDLKLQCNEGNFTWNFLLFPALVNRRCELKWELVHKIACERDCELSSHFSRCNELNDERVHIFVGERERELVQILREL